MHGTPAIEVAAVTEHEYRRSIPALAGILKDAVDLGAALGFFAPLTLDAAADYLASLAHEIGSATRTVVVARCGGTLVGFGQLQLPTMPAMRHRTELQKLCVLSEFRGRGIGQALVHALHCAAKDAGRSLVYLTTRSGEHAQTFYSRLGYSLAGIIRGYTIDAHGKRHDTALMFRELP